MTDMRSKVSCTELYNVKQIFNQIKYATDERSESESVNDDSSDSLAVGGHNNITTSHDITTSTSVPISKIAGKNLTSIPDMRTCKYTFSFSLEFLVLKKTIIVVLARPSTPTSKELSKEPTTTPLNSVKHKLAVSSNKKGSANKKIRHR